MLTERGGEGEGGRERQGEREREGERDRERETSVSEQNRIFTSVNSTQRKIPGHLSTPSLPDRRRTSPSSSSLLSTSDRTRKMKGQNILH